MASRHKLEDHIKKKHDSNEETLIEINLNDLTDNEDQNEIAEMKVNETESFSEFTNDLSELDSFDIDDNDLCLLDLDI